MVTNKQKNLLITTGNNEEQFLKKFRINKIKTMIPSKKIDFLNINTKQIDPIYILSKCSITQIISIEPKTTFGHANFTSIKS
jgi:hypothetical protein